jgi:hypothetical protein
MGQGMYGRKRKSLPLRASEGALQPRYQVPAQKGKWDWAWLEEGQMGLGLVGRSPTACKRSRIVRCPTHPRKNQNIGPSHNHTTRALAVSSRRNARAAALTLPRMYWTCASTTSFVRRGISRHSFVKTLQDYKNSLDVHTVSRNTD